MERKIRPYMNKSKEWAHYFFWWSLAIQLFKLLINDKLCGIYFNWSQANNFVLNFFVTKLIKNTFQFTLVSKNYNFINLFLNYTSIWRPPPTAACSVLFLLALKNVKIVLTDYILVSQAPHHHFSSSSSSWSSSLCHNLAVFSSLPAAQLV